MSFGIINGSVHIQRPTLLTVSSNLELVAPTPNLLLSQHFSHVEQSKATNG